MAEISKIDWCKNQSKGISLVEPNQFLSKIFLEGAEESLEVLTKVKETGSNMWISTIKYYAEYLAVYSFLMRVGIKSEIHSCTIELIRILEKEEIVNFQLSDRLEEDKDMRIDNQYYLKDIPVQLNMDELHELVSKIAILNKTLNEKQIKKIREIVFNT